MSELLPSLASLARALRGPLSFLRDDPEELYRLMPELLQLLPLPQRVYLADEGATPLVGYPVLASPGMKQLRETLASYIRAEEEAQVAALLRGAVDAPGLQAAWESYRAPLARATENVTTSSYGRHFPDFFWLLHSLDVARLLKETPRRITRLNLNLGKEQGGPLKYKVLYRYLDRVLSLTYDLARRLADDTEELEEEIFPPLLSRMRDNVLIFTEDHISPDLAELTHYLHGYLKIDGADLRFRYAKLVEWLQERLAADSDLRAAATHLLRVPPHAEARDLIRYRGFVEYLAGLPGYDSRVLFSPEQVQVWEALLVKLKEFELFHGIRRLVVSVQQHDNALVLVDRSLNRTWVAGPPTVEVSSATRPLDFMAPWVVDPQISRFGMIYDVTDFSHIVSLLRRASSDEQDRSFRLMFRFQRRVHRLAASQRLKLEKYLGDGAFYSARDAYRMLIVGLQVQRYYRQALEEGFPFNRGMRIALNFAQYRLLPIHGGGVNEPERYEFFGHGVVELSRLTTGKSMRELEEFKVLLVNLGYPEATVHRFFAPLTTAEHDVVDKREERRAFYAYINRNGNLVNEGIVATSQLVERLADEEPAQKLYPLRYEGRGYVALALELPDGKCLAGIRKLGIVKLKGLEPLAIYELVDGGPFPAGLQPLPGADLMTALDRDYATALTETSSV
ncbi:MAG TPA: hypothetical protein VGS57_15570 [Thermoanaerobaculia bacterium]|jgi:hypothetical protein|nr:hypothetical protein [Thermoanaerobaculia bacterium]